MCKFQIIRYKVIFNNYFKNQSIWNTLSTKNLVLSYYHEKGLCLCARISSALRRSKAARVIIIKSNHSNVSKPI